VFDTSKAVGMTAFNQLEDDKYPDFYRYPLPFPENQIDTLMPTKELALYIQDKCKGLGIFDSTAKKVGLYIVCNANGKIEKLFWGSDEISADKEQLFHQKLTEILSEFRFKQKPIRSFKVGGAVYFRE
jgi:hypothetical protein